jgi:hypothetical protein
MPHWLIKTALHRGISALPNRQFWNGLLQKWITRSTELTAEKFEGKVRECDRHLRVFRTAQPAGDFTVLELGTGWLPIIPAGLWICGAREIWTFDIDPLLQSDRVLSVLQHYSDYAKRGALSSLLPEAQADRIKRLDAVLAAGKPNDQPAVLLEKLDIHYQVKDAQQIPLPNNTINFLVSSGVLEYVPKPVFQKVLKEFRRVAALGAMMSHRLNLVDQYSYFDKKITAFNFLQFTEREWSWRDSPLFAQNRLRIGDYRKQFHEAGFEIVCEENVPGAPEDLAKIKLAPEFQQMTREDLLVLHSYISARRMD